MVQVANQSTFIREHVVNSKAGAEAREGKRYYTDRPLDGSVVEKLYRHATYLLQLYKILLEKDRNTDFGFLPDQNKRGLDRVRYGVYRELCDFGLEVLAKDFQDRYSPK